MTIRIVIHIVIAVLVSCVCYAQEPAAAAFPSTGNETADRFHALFVSGRTAVQEKNFAEARELFLKAYALRPGSMMAAAAVTAVYFQSNQHQEALRFLEQAEADFPREQDRVEMRQVRANVLSGIAGQEEREGHLDAAEAAMEQAFRLTPQSVRFLVGYARLRHKSGHFVEAESYLREALELFQDEKSREMIESARTKFRVTEMILKAASQDN